MPESPAPAIPILKIKRDTKGLFINRPVTVLYNKDRVVFESGKEKEWEVPGGNATLILNRRKKYTYKLIPGEEKELVLKEGIFKSTIVARYAILLLCTMLTLALFVYHKVTGNSRIVGVGSILLFCWAFAEVRYEYFYFEEKLK